MVLNKARLVRLLFCAGVTEFVSWRADLHKDLVAVGYLAMFVVWGVWTMFAEDIDGVHR